MKGRVLIKTETGDYYVIVGLRGEFYDIVLLTDGILGDICDPEVIEQSDNLYKTTKMIYEL